MSATLVFAGFVPLSRPAEAASVSFIRDTEIENTIRVYTAPLFKAAGLDIASVDIYLVKDKRLNAFVAGGQKLFIHTGLLQRAEGPGQANGREPEGVVKGRRGAGRLEHGDDRSIEKKKSIEELIRIK